ncbi:MAG: hypothetical protein IJP68_10670, partial [Selenomonadaceae bacterium]|nr:hypothetical protein [Selenomonadaceae bacterium]
IELMEGFAAKKGITLTEYCKQAVLDRLEDDEDIRDVEEILKEDTGEPLSHEEFWRRVGA